MRASSASSNAWPKPEVKIMIAIENEDVRNHVLQELDEDPRVPYSVQSTVQNGYVTLSGEVDWHYQQDEAERIVRNIAGVRGVTNRIVLRAHPAERDIRSRLARALHRAAQCDADSIRIAVDGGDVRLSGCVRTRFDRDEAERAAWSICGVRMVKDDIVVDER
jgi:osmotically-inducible protein OsmY